MAQLDFDASAVEPSTPFEALPAGKYLAVAVASEIKATKNGNGQYLKMTFEVIDGQFKGRKIFENLNIQNQNKQAEEIAQRALSMLCRATGVMKLADSLELHDKPVYLDLAVRPAEGTYSAQNQVKGYYSADGEAPKATATPIQGTVTKPAATSKPAWKRA